MGTGSALTVTGLAKPEDAMTNRVAASAACTTLRIRLINGFVAQRVMLSSTSHFLTKVHPDVTQTPYIAHGNTVLMQKKHNGPKSYYKYANAPDLIMLR